MSKNSSILALVMTFRVCLSKKVNFSFWRVLVTVHGRPEPDGFALLLLRERQLLSFTVLPGVAKSAPVSNLALFEARPKTKSGYTVVFHLATTPRAAAAFL